MHACPPKTFFLPAWPITPQRPGQGLGLGVLKTCHTTERRRWKRRKKGGKGKNENSKHLQSTYHPTVRRDLQRLTPETSLNLMISLGD